MAGPGVEPLSVGIVQIMGHHAEVQCGSQIMGHHAALWATMRKYNISANLVRTTEQLNDKATSAVQMNGLCQLN